MKEAYRTRAAASFATINNTDLANVYNMAGNQIGTALATAETQVLLAPSPKDCSAALATLVAAVSDARNTLETARTDSAAGALVRATAGQQAIKEVIAAQQDLTHVTLPGEITAITETTTGALITNVPRNVPADGPVTLTVKTIRPAAPRRARRPGSRRRAHSTGCGRYCSRAP